MNSIDSIIRKYTVGEARLDETNKALKEAGCGISIRPGRNEITDDDRMQTVVGYYPRQANGYGLLDTGTGSMDKVKVIDGKLEFAVNEVQPDGKTNMLSYVIICGRVYEVKGDTLVNPTENGNG